MPKAKTHSGAKKRFNVTGGGKIKRSCAYIGHKLTTSKTRKQKNRLHEATYVTQKSELRTVKRLLNLA
ncbi:MAG TPA: 50S ribosomal protein L35 [Candidatus Wallbacteria bacterium]|nr:50S ribosomal protein L35 [Candidatus Wallbacteria bacterium]